MAAERVFVIYSRECNYRGLGLAEGATRMCGGIENVIAFDHDEWKILSLF